MPEHETIWYEEIRKTIAAYNVAGDRDALEELGLCFTPDGVLVTPTQALSGRAEIVSALSEMHEHRIARVVRHHITATWIDITGDDTAVGRIYFFVVTDDGLDHAGIYSDDYQRLDAQWLIRSRQVAFDYVAEETRLIPPSSDPSEAGGELEPN
jgi:hypothetical protein